MYKYEYIPIDIFIYIYIYIYIYINMMQQIKTFALKKVLRLFYICILQTQYGYVATVPVEKKWHALDGGQDNHTGSEGI